MAQDNDVFKSITSTKYWYSRDLKISVHLRYNKHLLAWESRTRKAQISLVFPWSFQKK